MMLKEYRLKNGLTQEQVADYLGIPKKTYQNYEREVRDADSDVLCALADCYGITLDQLVGRDGGGSDLAANIKQLESLYVSMSDDGRDALMIVASGLAERFPGRE
ncbi:XRE family transcriptional regulator [Collinsella sp. AM41-2BH]|jgi:transcriptional regulator with XRE-family HTH domain|uniref:helix-turn-helix domain-containing protein n=1 Tax=Collinsella sp. AM41-2BH TaxID=2292320 RepID=UPI000E4A0B86|nr:helix-turn-helix transcriptional regulator [Collinsella sp. AM41-2BH]RHB11034.1 XRE family transcriptional regulator [Collinsella sp. AM41-2BH]